MHGDTNHCFITQQLLFTGKRHLSNCHIFFSSCPLPSTLPFTVYQAYRESPSDTCAQEPISSHRQEGLKVLVRVEGQGREGQPLGPWPLDVEQRTMEEVYSAFPNTCMLWTHCNAVLVWYVLEINLQYKQGGAVRTNLGRMLH